MLACERWTFTQSSGWEAVALELGLALGLAVMRALSDAVAVAEAVDEVWDDDGEADFDDEAEPDGEAELVREDEDGAVGEGDVDRRGPGVGVLVGLLLGLDVVAEPRGDGDGEGDGEGEGFRDGLGEGDGEGDGDGVLEAGSSWQVLPVLAEAVGLAVAVTGLSDSACAVPDQAASAPKITGPPASKLSVVARTCPERTDIALSTMLVTVTVWSS